MQDNQGSDDNVIKLVITSKSRQQVFCRSQKTIKKSPFRVGDKVKINNTAEGIIQSRRDVLRTGTDLFLVSFQGIRRWYHPNQLALVNA